MNNSTVAILMCTYQGERFLEKQLLSIAQQTHTNWTLYVSDDGSTDQTISILKKYASLWKKNQLILYSGPQQGFAANFFFLLHHPDISADYYALADQDDIWQKEKLQKAIQHLKGIDSNTIALYCTRTQLINENDQPIGYTPLYTKPACFKNALVQNIAGGNTMVLNQAAKKLLQLTPKNVKITFHDWWIYLLITACDGKVIYDIYPSVLYRQHTHNQIGANQSFWALLLRFNLLLNGRFADWNDSHIKALLQITHLINKKNLISFHQFRTARLASLIPRLMGLIKSGVFRQTPLGNLKLLGAALLKKI